MGTSIKHVMWFPFGGSARQAGMLLPAFLQCHLIHSGSHPARRPQAPATPASGRQEQHVIAW